jgi:hypothetical protein
VTTFEKTRKIIADLLTERAVCIWAAAEDLADDILIALREKRIAPITMRASPEFFTRFHAHCRHLGTETEYGYGYWYQQAVDHAVSVDEWPVKVQPTKVVIDDVEHTIDVVVAQSTTKATNKQLMSAYQIIEEGAKEHGVVLPEDPKPKKGST